MQRYDAIKKIVETVDDEFIVSNIGFPSRELFGIKDNKCTFHLPTRWTEERTFYTWKRRISFFGPH